MGWFVVCLAGCLLVGRSVSWLVGLVGFFVWLVGWLVCWLVGLFVGWKVGMLVGWLKGWLIGWLVGR